MRSIADTNDMAAVPNTLLEPVDLAMLACYEEVQLDGEPDLIVELVDLYLEDAPRRVAAMRDAFGKTDWRSMKREAHSLRGSSGSLGGQQMALICSEIEATESSDPSSDVAGLLSRLDQEFERVVHVLKAERERRLQLESS